MPGVKGKTNNPNGRTPGTPNKDTAQLRSFITRFIKKNSKKLQEDFDKMDAKDRVAMFERLLKYALPTLQATTITTDIDKLSPEQVDILFKEIIKDGTK
jgi:hypothetical protein